ncbi:helix-turn-helix domain-containing protein [Halalkalibacterium halodurans]|jgi:two-component system response regulator YesN|uniref:Two-component system, response regulator YesN n=1 Tax=Halalkalibacterium halodurans TaxID=86665 RepID=A0A0M0KMB0_ALKHA|nr:helix-turn-helix domain-containing protein [Halalkalibacterium halodurans]MDY7221489.1 response regulator [Halalkalibacterium halodurans]MDY7240765.1 response regulator [Halalkalibacterium halodurans]MED4161271.1 response regulator [Halalkalibacterium halodurans]TES49001.1 response regulator [Halalkalibacterium halodurans]TPE67887.1 response regulator [Halalkalibacterium halodurans]
MYKVMLVDDDYPVLELLSETIEWEKLGLTLQSTHENGASALDYALQEEMPDILITDIGMPKMNGIELIKQMKEKNPLIQVSVLSCHSDYEFTRQALLLQIQDYLLKDTLNPEDLTSVLTGLKKNIERENEKTKQETKLHQIASQNQESRKREFIRKTINQPTGQEKEWYEEARSYGFDVEDNRYIPALCFMQNYRMAKQLDQPEDQLVCSIQRVVQDVLETYETKGIHFAFSLKEFFLLFPYRSSVKSDCYGIMMECVSAIQRAVHSDLQLSLGCVIGEHVHNQSSFKREIEHLVKNKNQRFYMKAGAIEKKQPDARVTEGLFNWYDEAAVAMRRLIIERNQPQVKQTVHEWIERFASERYSFEAVKEWVLKLLLDVKVKLKALQFFNANYSEEVLHEEVFAIDTLDELSAWLTDYFDSLLAAVVEITSQTRRKEVLEAFQYVSAHLEKKITLEEVANHLFLNPSYFSRLFKKEVGETFVEYVTKAKMNRAKELLEQTVEPVGKICERLGYDNQSYFIKVFKSYEGITPIEYRGEHV